MSLLHWVSQTKTHSKVKNTDSDEIIIVSSQSNVVANDADATYCTRNHRRERQTRLTQLITGICDEARKEQHKKHEKSFCFGDCNVD